MNLTLIDKLVLVGVEDDSTTTVFRDDIGFSAGNLLSGFNTSDASPEFTDGEAVSYPEMSEVALFLIAEYIPFDPDKEAETLTTARTTTLVRPSLTDADIADPAFDYADHANEWSVEVPKSGWIRTRLVQLAIDDDNQDYYYSTTDEAIIRSSDDEEVELADIIESLDYAEQNFLSTALIDEHIAFVEQSYTMSLVRGKCKDEDTWRRHISVLQLARVSAKIAFDSFGNRYQAQQIVEYIIQYLQVNDLEKPNV